MNHHRRRKSGRVSDSFHKIGMVVLACFLIVSLFPNVGLGYAEESGEQQPTTLDENLEPSSQEGLSDESQQSVDQSPDAIVEADEDASLPPSDAAGGDLNAPEIPVAPRAGEIASLTGSVLTSPSNPLSGSDFKMAIELNSTSEGAATSDDLQGAQISFTIPTNVIVRSAPSSNGLYTVTPSNPQPGDTVVIAYAIDVPVGSLQKVEFTFAFPAGISPSSESFEPVVSLTATNAYPYTMNTPVVNPSNVPLGQTMQVDGDGANPIFLHSAEVVLTREAYYGGLNQEDAVVNITFPGAAHVVSVMYQGVNYPVVDDGSGGKVATVPVGVLNVGDQGNKERITLLYRYPPMTTPGTTDYEIQVTYSATRFDGTPISENASINETVSYGDGNVDVTSLFSKGAPGQVYRVAEQPVTFELGFSPYADTKGATLTDDPIRAGETDFFQAVEYRTFTWSASGIMDPSQGQIVRTQMFYQTKNEPGVWKSVGAATATGRIDVSSLGLTSDDAVTQVQFKFFGTANDEIPAGSSPVTIQIQGITTEGITETGTSFDDGLLTNAAYLTGAARASAEEPYAPIDDDGVNNVHKTDTSIIANDPAVGFAGWENPVSPNPAVPGGEITYSMRYYTTNSVLRDPISYVIVDPAVDVMDVQIDSRFPDATWSVVAANNGCKVVVIEWNDDNGSPWTQYSVSVKGLVNQSVGSSLYFRYLVASGDETQRYSGGNAGIVNSWYLNQWQDTALIDMIGGTYFGATYRNTIGVDNSLGMNPRKTASLDASSYALTQTIDTSSSPLGEPAYYSLSVTNPQSTSFEEIRIIDMLPTLGDTMTLSSNPKKSTVALPVTGITMLDGSALPASCQLYYSEDADAVSNKAELSDFSQVTATWIAWDGTSSLPTSAKALKIVKEDGLAASESFKVRLQVLVPQNTTGSTLVGWNSMSAGGRYPDGYITPGEPHKSGIYVSENTADRQLGGILWRDENGNGLRDEGEPVLNGKTVRLYDWDGSFVSDTITDSDGRYGFTGLLPESYSVQVDVPANDIVTGYRVGDDRTIDNDFARTDTYLATAYSNLASEQNPLEIDGGFYNYASLGDYVWNDANYNGLQDPQESGVAGVQVTLYKVTDDGETLAGTATTEAGGQYSFPAVAPGTYRVGIAPVSGYGPTHYAVGGMDATNNSKIRETWSSDSFALVSGQARTDMDAGIVRNLNGSIMLTKVGESDNLLSGAVFGIWAATDDPETDIPSATATSEAGGSVTFADIPQGDYLIQEVSPPMGYEPTSASYSATVSNAQLNVDLGNVVNELSPGFVSLTKVNATGDFLAGAEFGIWHSSQDPAVDEALITMTSGDDGSIVFGPLDQGEYLIKEIGAPEGYVLSETVHAVTLDTANVSVDRGRIENIRIDEPVTPPSSQTTGSSYETLKTGDGSGMLIGGLATMAFVACAVGGLSVRALRSRRQR